ncbi:hypothetical protein BSKO_04225 [Bryopsis sp. KO-2023]|nr:hypothetical protein BSKO_04225 [Bryopsis sp. KO-2023]
MVFSSPPPYPSTTGSFFEPQRNRGPWENLTSGLERAYQLFLDVTQVYFATTFIGGGGPHSPPPYFLAGHNGGELRLFALDEVVRNPSSRGADVFPVLTIKAHNGPVYNLAKVELEDDVLVLSCGYDGAVCGWSWNEIHAAVRAGNSGAEIPQVRPRFRVRVPKLDKSEGETGVNAIGVDGRNKKFFAGDWCGYWHMWGLDEISTSPEMSIQSHSAMILDVKFCARNALLATSSEDGTACIWDCRHSSRLSAFDPAKGCRLPMDRSQRSQGSYPFAPCVAFDPDSNWLMCGSSKKSVCLWNIRADMAVQQIQTEAVPHAIAAHGNDLYVVGEEPYLNRYNFQGQQVSRSRVIPEVAYSIEVNPNTQIALLSGTESSIQVVSPEGMSLGKVTSRKMQDSAGEGEFPSVITISDSDDDVHSIGDGW